MDLETFWFCLIVVVWAMYFLLEGFDFGVGMLLPFVPRSDEERSARAADDRTGLGRERGLARRGGRRDVRGLPGVVRDDVLGLLPRAPAHPLLPHRPRRLVRVALEERDAWLALDCGRGRTRSAASAPRFCGGSGSRASLYGTPIDSEGDFTGDLLDLFSPYSVFAGIAVVALFAFHGATFLTLRTMGDLRDRAEAVARRLAIPGAVLGAAYLVWTVVVAMDRNDKDLLPPALPAALGIVALALAVVFILTASYGRAFAMTGARRDLARRHALRRACIHASWSRAPTSRTASRSTAPRRRTTRSL